MSICYDVLVLVTVILKHPGLKPRAVLQRKLKWKWYVVVVKWHVYGVSMVLDIVVLSVVSDIVLVVGLVVLMP